MFALIHINKCKARGNITFSPGGSGVATKFTPREHRSHQLFCSFFEKKVFAQDHGSPRQPWPPMAAGIAGGPTPKRGGDYAIIC